MNNLRVSLFVVFLSLPFFSKTESFCTLQPENFDNSRESIQIFEENIEEKITEIYQNEYPELSEQLHLQNKAEKAVRDFQNIITRKYVQKLRRHHKNPTLSRAKMKKRKTIFLNLIEQDIQNPDEWNTALQDFRWIRTLSFEEYRSLFQQIFKLKQALADINNKIRPMQAPHFLYVPEIDLTLRGENIYGNLQIEAFFHPPKENLFQLPLLKIGFETNQNTVIYICMHLDNFDLQKNSLYVYFLNTTKLYNLKWTDVFLNFNLFMRNLLTIRQPPRAHISPLPFVLNPTRLQTLQKARNNPLIADQLTSLSKVTNIVDKLDFINVTANLNPIVKIIINNVDFGIKGILIKPHRLQVRYAGSALYNLINFNLAQHSQKADFSSFMNILTMDSINE